MGDKTKIEWTDATWNPLRGCSRVSEGCRNCYAETVANRFKGKDQPYEGLIARTGQWNGEIKLVPEKLSEPLRWKRPRHIFVNSMSDLFHENVPFEFIASVFAIMAVTTRHTYQVLTKRPARMLEFFKWVHEENAVGTWCAEERITQSWPKHIEWEGYDNCGPRYPYENVWLGVSVEDQKTADERIPLLLKTPAAVRWISAEPLLGQIDFAGMWVEHKNPAIHENMLEKLDWVVAGGESGAHARPSHPDWFRSLRDQCAAAGVPFLFKQWGEWTPSCGLDKNGVLDFSGGVTLANDGTSYDPVDLAYPNGRRYGEALHAGHENARLYSMYKRGKKKAGRRLDGRTHDDYPSQQQPGSR